MSRDSSYFLADDGFVEQSRLVLQDQLVTAAVGYFPPDIAPSDLQDILDVGCGPGGWLLDIVTIYPHLRAIGIDNSEAILTLAAHLQKAEMQSLRFQYMDARKTLDFPDASFDYIQVRLAQSFLHKHMWADFLRECYRLLRPRGTLRVIDLETVLANTPGADKMHGLPPLVYSRAGLIFSETGRSQGILAGLRALVPQIGFVNPQVLLHPIDASYGAAGHAISIEDTRLIHAGWKDFIAEKLDMSIEELEEIVEQGISEMIQPGSACISILFSVYAQKPYEGDQ